MDKRFVKKLTKLFNDKHYVLIKEEKSDGKSMPYHRVHFEIPNISKVQIIERFNYSGLWEIATRTDNIIDGSLYRREVHPDINVELLFNLCIKEKL
jgi:hypothetical protein